MSRFDEIQITIDWVDLGAPNNNLYALIEIL